MIDSYGDGWNGTDLIINGSFTFETGILNLHLFVTISEGCVSVQLQMAVIQRRCLGLLVMLQVKN